MDNVNTLVYTNQAGVNQFLENKYKAAEIYKNLEGVETIGEKKIHEDAIGVVANKFNEIGRICAERGTTLVIDYDERKNNYTLYEYPAKISSISEISQSVLNGNGKINKKAVLNGKNIGNATFTFANESGTTFGSNRNVNFGFVDKDQSWKILPAAEAKLSMFVKYLQRERNNVVTNRTFGSAMSVTTRQMNTPYNPKASGAQNEYRRLMQKTSGQNSISDLNYAAEDLARSKAIIVSNILQSASYSIDESNKYLDQVWQIAQWVIQGQNIEVVRASEAFKKIFSANSQKANQVLQKIINLRDQYSLQDIDLGIASENTQNTGSLGYFKTARNIESAGTYIFKRPQNVQQAVSFYKKKDKKIYSRSPKRSTEAEKKVGLVRGRDVSYKEGDVRPEDAVVIVAEVSAVDENIGKDTFLDDNVVVSKELLKQTAGSNELRVTLRNNQKKDRNRIIRKSIKNLLKSGNLKDVDITGKTDDEVYDIFNSLDDDQKAEIYKNIWVNEAKRKNRDWHNGDEQYNNITATIDENGNIIITGMEQRVGRWGDKIIGGPVKGSATKSDAALAYVRNRSQRNVQALFSTSKGNVRNVGPQEYQTALSALEGEYGTSLGLYYNGGQGAERAMELIGKVASNKNETDGQQMAAKVLQTMYSASDGGFQTNKNLFEAIKELYTEEKDQVLALKSILPLIDRLINGIDKSNELMSYEDYNKIKDEDKYYHVDPTTGDVSRTTKDLITFLNLHGPGEYKWGGLNVSGAKETLRRSMTMAATANGIENVDKAINEVVDSLDIESDKLREFTELQNKAKASIEETGKTAQLSRQGTDSVLKSGWQGDVGNSDYIVVIKPNADDKNAAEIDLSSIESATWENGEIINEDQTLKGRLLNKLAELDSSGVDKNRIKFVIDSGKGFGGIDSKGNRWGGNALYVPQGFTGDEQYFNELSYLVSLIQSGEDENITNSQYRDVLLQILQDFQNKGSVYDKYHGDPTKGVMPAKFLSMPINWLRKAFEDGGIPQNDKLSQFQADVATQGMFISNDMFWKQIKELTNEQIDELYDKIFEGFDGDNFDRTNWSRSKKLKKIRSALTYNENPDSLFNQVLNKGNFDEGTILQLLFRSPFVSALAGKTIRKVFINSDLSGSDAVMLNPGAAAAIDADYDGDQGGIREGWHYTDEAKELLNLTAKSEEELNKKLSFYKLQSVMSDAGYQWKDGRFQTVENGKIKIIDDETAKTLFDKNIVGSAAVLSRSGRGNIGKLSNLSSEFRNMLRSEGYDEIGLPNASDNTKQSIYSGMIGRVFLQALEQDAISSKKIINRMMKLRGDNRGAENLSEDELQKEYKKSVEVVDKILDDFYSGQINFDGENGLLSSLQKIGVLEEDGSLKSNVALQKAVEFIHKQSGGDSFLKKIFGDDISFDDKDLGTDKYYFAQNLSSQGIKDVFGDISQRFGTNASGLLRSLPWKNYTPEKKTIKDKDISNNDLKNVDKAWMDHVKALNQAEDASVSEAQAESNKIIIAGKEAKAIEALSKQYNILADSVDEANNKQFLTGHSIADSAFPLTFHKKIGEKDESDGEEGKYNSEFYMARGSYVSDLATFGEDNDRTKQSRTRYEESLKALNKTPDEIKAAFDEAAAWADKFREQIKDETLGLTNAKTYGETKLTAQSKNKLQGVADVIKIGEEGAVIIEQKTSTTNKITGNQIAQVRSYQAMLENLRGLFKGFFESTHGKYSFYRRNDGTVLGPDETYEGLVNNFLKQSDISSMISGAGIKGDDLEQLKSVLIGLFESGGGRRRADGTQLYDKAIGIKVNLVDDSGKIHTYEDTNHADYSEIFWKLLNDPSSITDREASILTAGTYRNEGADGTLSEKKSRGNKRRVSSSRKKFDRVAEIEKVLKQKEELLEEQYNLTKQRDSFQQGSDEYQIYDSALGAVNDKITKLDESFNKLNTFKAVGKLKSKTDFKQETRDAINGLQQQYETQYKIFIAQKEAAEQKKKEKDEQTQLNNALDKYATTLKAVTKYEQIQKAATQKANLSTGRARTTQLQIAQDAATLAERYRSQQRVIESSDIYKNNQKEFANVFGDWLLTNELAESQTEGQNRGARNIFDVIGDDVKRAFRRITDFGVAARILNKVQREIANVYQNILKLNEAMTDIRIVTGASVDEANSLMTSYNKLAKELGTTTTEVAKSASEWMRQGYTASESVNLITSSVKLARLGFMDMSSATTSLTAVLKGFNLQATASSEIVDKLTKLDAEYATTAGDIATALSRTAAAAKAANLDLDQTASMLTTIIDITQQDAGSVGNALKTILSRYGNVKAGVFAGMEEDGEDASESINDVEKVLNAIGIQIRSTSTEMRGFDEVLDDLAEKWDNLNDVEQNAVATAMAGVRQRNQFLALMQNYDQYKKSLESSRTSSGTADEKYAAVMDSIATSMQRIQTAWEGFTQKLKASGFVKGFFEAIAGVVENMNVILPVMVSFLSTILVKQLPALGTKIDDLFGQPIRKFGSEAKKLFKGKKEGKTAADYYRESNEERLLKARQRMNPYQKSMLSKMEIIEKEVRGIATNNKVDTSKIQETPLYFDGMTRIGASRFYNEKLKELNSRYHNYSNAPYRVQNYLHKMHEKAKSDPNYEMLPVEKSLYDKYGYIEDIDSENKEINRQYDLFKKAKKKEITTRMIGTGLMTGISSGMAANYGDFTNTGDKVLNGVISGGIAAIGSAFGPIGSAIGSILGPLAGQWIGKKFYDEFHKAEIARRKRVDEAKKQLEATQKVETAITSAEELISKDRSEWGSEEYKQEKELIDQMRLGLQTSSSLAENFAKLSGKSTEASDWILKLSSDLTKLDESVVANYRAAQILTEAQETYKAGEEDRAALYDKLGSAESSMLNQIQNMDSASSEYLEKRKEYESEYGRTVESGIASMQQAQMQLDSFTDALHEGYMKAAFYSSGVSQMSSTDISGASLDRVVAEVARAWAASDATALVFANGTLLDSARKQIVAYLKTQSDFTSLTKSPGGSLRDIMDARDEIGLYLQRTKGDYEKLKNIVNQQDFKAIREFFGYNAESNKNDSYIKDLIDQINKADPSNIELIAHGMNMTTEQAESLKSVIGSISLEDILNGSDKLLDKFETLNGILGDISEDTILSPENMNKVVSAFPDLFKEFDENGNFTGNISSGNIVGNLAKLVTDPNGAFATAYAGLAAKGSLTDKNKWKIFQDSVKANKEALLTAEVITDKQFSDIMTAKDFNSQAQLMLNNEKLMAEWAKIVSETTAVADYAEQARNILIEAENKSLEKQIDNLQSIKDSIGDINKQREKELDLIKARDALENAKKDKKLVYRAGIGFVAQADTSAIQEAQKKVEDLQNQQTQEDLQYQIDQLNQQKAILDAIKNDPNMESLKNTAEIIKDELTQKTPGGILGLLKNLDSENFSNNIRDGIVKSITEKTLTVGQDTYKTTKSSLDSLLQDYKDFYEMEDYEGSGQSVKSILEDPSNIYFSSVSDIIKEKQSSIESKKNELDTLKEKYFSGDNEALLGNYGGPVGNIQDYYKEKYSTDYLDVSKLKFSKEGTLLDLENASGDYHENYFTMVKYTNEEVSDDTFTDNTYRKYKKSPGKSWEALGKSWEDIVKNDQLQPGDFILVDKRGNKLAYVGTDKKLYWVQTKKPKDQSYGGNGDINYTTKGNNPDIDYSNMRAKGDYNYQGGKVLINELGTEAIVTPQGTLTSLPSHSGIVPADLTKNLFSLGEIAPNLIATLRNQMPNVSKSNATSNDNSTNIGTVYATFNADSGFDMNRFMIDLRSAAGNTRHNN